VIARADYASFKNIVNASLGELQFDGAGLVTGQVRVESGTFEAQAFGIAATGGKHAWFYRKGSLMTEESTQWAIQARNRFSLFRDRIPLSVGLDYVRTTPRSKGTVFGRFEGTDAFDLIGGYASTSVQLVGAVIMSGSGRLDYLGTTGDVVFSPRVALVVQASPKHAFRIAYNKALARPDACKYYCDLQVDAAGGMPIRYMGSSEGMSFGDPPQTTSFFGGGRDAGVGVSLDRVYGAFLTEVAQALAPGNSQAMEALLATRASEIEGFSNGRMAFRSPQGDLLGVVETLRDITPLKEPVTQSVEVGYRGVMSDRVVLEVVGSYTRRSRFQFDQMITPMAEVRADRLGPDLEEAVLASFSDSDLTSFGISANELAETFSALAAPGDYVTVGLMEPDENYDPYTISELVLTSVNAGKVDYFGAEASADVVIGEGLTAYANYSWISDNHFDESELGLSGTGFLVSMNAPTDKWRLGFSYEPVSGAEFTSDVRYTGSFRVDDGQNYHGMVDAYTLVDLGFSVDFRGAAAGLTLAVNASNIFNKMHREYIGFPRIGRLVSSRLTYTF
jgi:iron complex outermembrane receptor protein